MGKWTQCPSKKNPECSRFHLSVKPVHIVGLFIRERYLQGSHKGNLGITPLFITPDSPFPWDLRKLISLSFAKVTIFQGFLHLVWILHPRGISW